MYFIIKEKKERKKKYVTKCFVGYFEFATPK